MTSRPMNDDEVLSEMNKMVRIYSGDPAKTSPSVISLTSLVGVFELDRSLSSSRRPLRKPARSRSKLTRSSLLRKCVLIY